jgi:hypothetical protein
MARQILPVGKSNCFANSPMVSRRLPICWTSHITHGNNGG